MVSDTILPVMMMSDDSQNREYYNYDAWGEHYDSSSLPASENLIRYIGARVETFIDSESEQDAIYEMGVRHYWATYGRFLQRDPLTYTKLPRPSNPKSVNPYIYAENNPVTKLDPSGYSAMVRGARMGNQSFQLGTGNLPVEQLYNCCGPQGFHTLSDLTLEFQLFAVHGNSGFNKYFTYGQMSAKENKGLCDMDPQGAQPVTPACEKWTEISSDWACTYLKNCKGGTCGNPFEFCRPGDVCVSGISNCDGGFESTSQDAKIPVTDRKGVTKYLRKGAVDELLNTRMYMNLYMSDKDQKAIYGWGSSTWGGLASLGQVVMLLNSWYAPRLWKDTKRIFPHENIVGCVEMKNDIAELMKYLGFDPDDRKSKYFVMLEDEYRKLLGLIQHHWMDLQYLDPYGDYPGETIRIKFDPWSWKTNEFEFIIIDK
jgi:RHS repeat-associated protein